MENLESEEERLMSSLENLRAEESETRFGVAAANERFEAIQETIAGRTEEAEALKASIEELRSDVADREERRDALDGEVAAKTATAAEMTTRADMAEQRLADANARSVEAAAALDSSRTEQSQLNAELSSVRAEVESEKSELASVDAQRADVERLRRWRRPARSNRGWANSSPPFIGRSKAKNRNWRASILSALNSSGCRPRWTAWRQAARVGECASRPTVVEEQAKEDEAREELAALVGRASEIEERIDQLEQQQEEWNEHTGLAQAADRSGADLKASEAAAEGSQENSGETEQSE